MSLCSFDLLNIKNQPTECAKRQPPKARLVDHIQAGLTLNLPKSITFSVSANAILQNSYYLFIQLIIIGKQQKVFFTIRIITAS